MTVWLSPRPRPWPPCAPRCAPSATSAPTGTTAIEPTACLRMAFSLRACKQIRHQRRLTTKDTKERFLKLSKVELEGKLHESSVEDLRRLLEDTAGSRRAERAVRAGEIHDGADIE